VSLPKTITVPRWVYLSMTICCAISGVMHLFRLATDLIR
jgi:hypothetical protein